MPSTFELEALLRSAGRHPTEEQEAQLREAICRFAAEAKKEGMPTDAVIREIHEAVKAAGNTTSDPMIQRVIEWCLAEYYREVA